MSKKKIKLTPPDLERCQAEVKEGSFMTLGPRSYRRCANQPAVIVTEVQPGADGQRGSMSLCLSCRDMLIKKCGADYFTEERIRVA